VHRSGRSAVVVHVRPAGVKLCFAAAQTVYPTELAKLAHTAAPPPFTPFHFARPVARQVDTYPPEASVRSAARLVSCRRVATARCVRLVARCPASRFLRHLRAPAVSSLLFHCVTLSGRWLGVLLLQKSLTASDVENIRCVFVEGLDTRDTQLLMTECLPRFKNLEVLIVRRCGVTKVPACLLRVFPSLPFASF
jgi:hypothetical protein